MPNFIKFPCLNLYEFVENNQSFKFNNYTHNPPAAPEHPIVEVDAGPKQVVTGQN
jgi:hypothetical protein